MRTDEKLQQSTPWLGSWLGQFALAQLAMLWGWLERDMGVKASQEGLYCSLMLQ